MQSVAIALQTAIAAWLLLGQPFSSKYKYEKLKLTAGRAPSARRRAYLVTIATEWSLVLAAALSLQLGRTNLADLGLKPPQSPVTWWICAAAAAGVVGLTLYFRTNAEAREAYRSGMEHISHLLPSTGGERALFAAVAVTAGVCEEFLYRGFLTLYLLTIAPSLPTWAAALLAAIIFGLGHAYQGWRGIVQTGLLGGAFAVFVMTTGSLYGAMAVHALVDLLALFLSWVVMERRSTTGTA